MSRSRRYDPARRASGLTLVEVLVGLAIIGLMTGIGVPALQNLVHRNKIESQVRETAVFMRLARLEAIRSNRPVMLVADVDTSEIVVFVDENFDALLGPEDKRIGWQRLPTGVSFSAPGGLTGVDSVEGLIIEGNLAEAVFLSDGSAHGNGALRFGDRRENYLEVRIEPFTTAQISVRKWNGSTWLAQGEEGETWSWN